MLYPLDHYLTLVDVIQKVTSFEISLYVFLYVWEFVHIYTVWEELLLCVNRTEMFTFYRSQTGSPLLVPLFFIFCFPPCCAGKSSHVQYDGCVYDNCSIVFPLFLLLVQPFSFCTINHLFSLSDAWPRFYLIFVFDSYFFCVGNNQNYSEESRMSRANQCGWGVAFRGLE